MLRIRSCLVMPQILQNTAISKTLNFRLCSSFIVHVSLLYSRADYTRDWYSFTLVSAVISFDFQISSKFLTTPDAIPILLAISLLHEEYADITSKLSDCFNSVMANLMFIFAHPCNTLYFSFRVADFKIKCASSSMQMIVQILQVMLPFPPAK